MKVTKIITVEIDHCRNQCPYFENEMNLMICTHPEAPSSGLIIKHPECDTGFPDLCPIVKSYEEEKV